MCMTACTYVKLTTTINAGIDVLLFIYDDQVIARQKKSIDPTRSRKENLQVKHKRRELLLWIPSGKMEMRVLRTFE